MILGWFRDVFSVLQRGSRQFFTKEKMFDQKKLVRDGVSNTPDRFRRPATGTRPARQPDYRHRAWRRRKAPCPGAIFGIFLEIFSEKWPARQPAAGTGPGSRVAGTGPG